MKRGRSVAVAVAPQRDFWPELASTAMVSVARLVGSRAKPRSGSEERGAASAGRQASPIGNHGDNVSHLPNEASTPTEGIA